MEPKYSLKDLCLYFLKLGALGFGGPVALVGYMHRDLVVNRQWISEDDYREGMALSQLAPGPLAAQLGIYLGYAVRFLAAVALFLCSVCTTYSQEKEWAVFETDHRIVYDICFAKNGEQLIVADGNTIKVFATESQQLLQEFDSRTKGQILTLDISDDNTLLVSGGKDSTVTIWDFPNNKLLKSVPGRNGMVTSVNISPDNRWIAFGGTDDKVILYDLQTHSITHEFTDHSDDVTSVSFNHDGSLLASASADKTIKIYDLSNFTIIASLTGHSRWVRDLAFSGDGKTLISCGDDRRVITWNVTNLQQIYAKQTIRAGTNWLLSVDIHPDNTTYAVGEIGGRIAIKGLFAKYSKSTRFPIHRILFKPNEGINLKVVVASRGNGVFMMDAKDM